MGCVLIQYLLCKKPYQVVELTFQPCIFPDPVQVGVRFEDMQMGIHSLAFIRIFLAEAHIGYFVPFTGKRFTITILQPIKAVGLYIIE